jgi:hypothetical protein
LFINSGFLERNFFSSCLPVEIQDADPYFFRMVRVWIRCGSDADQLRTQFQPTIFSYSAHKSKELKSFRSINFGFVTYSFQYNFCLKKFVCGISFAVQASWFSCRVEVRFFLLCHKHCMRCLVLRNLKVASKRRIAAMSLIKRLRESSHR